MDGQCTVDGQHTAVHYHQHASTPNSCMLLPAHTFAAYQREPLAGYVTTFAPATDTYM